MKDIMILTNAIRNEDGDKMSIGSLRTLKLIETEYGLLQIHADQLRKQLVDAGNYIAQLEAKHYSS
jgi:hypothetical protein